MINRGLSMVIFWVCLDHFSGFLCTLYYSGWPPVFLPRLAFYSGWPAIKLPRLPFLGPLYFYPDSLFIAVDLLYFYPDSLLTWSKIFTFQFDLVVWKSISFWLGRFDLTFSPTTPKGHTPKRPHPYIALTIHHIFTQTPFLLGKKKSNFDFVNCSSYYPWKIWEIEAKKGWPSADRNNKATLLLTGPFRAAKSSAKDLTPRVIKLQYVN